MKIGIVLLAAGASRRMGSPKQLLPFKGMTLIEHVCKETLALKDKKVVVVLGAKSEIIRPYIQDLPVEVVVNEDWDNGMGGSIATGVSFIQMTNFNPEVFLILVCDQPFLTANYLNHLIDKHTQTQKGIIVSAYAGTIGVPALFHQTYLADLLSLKEQGGAKKLFTKYAHDLQSIPFEHGEIDLDTPEDYERFGK